MNSVVLRGNRKDQVKGGGKVQGDGWGEGRGEGQGGGLWMWTGEA